jgi:hypothetical protein
LTEPPLQSAARGGAPHRRRPSRHSPPARSRRARRRSTLLIVLAIVVPQLVLAGALATALGVLPGQDRSSTANAEDRRAEGPLGVGDCVRPRTDKPDLFAGVACRDHRVHGKVIAVIDGPPSATEACSEPTDFFATQPGQVICLRRTSGDHPGDPGRGGGVYRAGDCVAADAATGVSEVPCGAPTEFETVVDRVATVAECRPPAVRFATLENGAARVLCLGDGAGMAGDGECIGDPARPPVTFEAIPCADPAARARVLTRVATRAACQAVSEQTHYVEDPSGLPTTRVVCLHRLR